MIYAAWAALEIACRRILSCRALSDDIDVRDPLIDLTVCPTCGADLTADQGAPAA